MCCQILNDQEQSDKVQNYLENEKTILSHLDEIHTFIEEQNSAPGRRKPISRLEDYQLSNRKDAFNRISLPANQILKNKRSN